MSDSLDLGDPVQPRATQPYRVLARKYRPQLFSELIGQDAMVTTLGNAIKRNRLAHAFLMTGVRGVGKTSTARLIAKAMNCDSGPTIDPCGTCSTCVAIAEGRHIDVIEMDAASHTGVDDVREIIEGARYSAVSARFKIYIIDEVHMLSKNAFNALLKTLEEPPPHVKFVFATTEINKVPITVLSRCQRFDLRRISADMLVSHFARIMVAEGVAAEPEALALIARAAEGSVRDGLSILDQAIAHAGMGGDDLVTARQVRDMLGLSDRGAIRQLFGCLIGGDSIGALALMQEQSDLGIDPIAVLRGLLDITHGITLTKVGATADPAQSAEERQAFAEWAVPLSFATLHRLWQLLLKGHGEVGTASDPKDAGDMILLRIIHASQLPDPAELAKLIENADTMSVLAPAAPVQPTLAPPAPAPPTPVSLAAAASSPTSLAAAPTSPTSLAAAASSPTSLAAAASSSSSLAAAATIPGTYVAMIELLENAGRNNLGYQLREEIGLVRYAPPLLAIQPHRPFDVGGLATVLKELTGTPWQVVIEAAAQAEPTLKQQDDIRAQSERDAVLAQPVVVAALAAFPGAELIDYTITNERSAAS